jgi:hypothetical protein
MPAGRLEGTLDARGFAVLDTYLWCYDQSSGTRAPDSTARDFDALGLADADGHFRVVGLPVPGRYRLWTFADLNANRSYEPASDILAPVDTTLELTPARPALTGLTLRVVNPRAPGRIDGTVLDSSGVTAGERLIQALCASDSTLRPRVEPAERDTFKLSLPAGIWRLRAFRDLDKDRRWKPETEPASAEATVPVTAAGEAHDVVLVLRPVGRGP